jgi:DNA-binding transcriptional MerR regulator
MHYTTMSHKKQFDSKMRQRHIAHMEQQEFPLEGLLEIANRALGDTEQKSARVQERPDVRTIRYYASLGLLDKPLYFQGRTAFYGERHVAQLVAIKRLQAQQLSLQEIQHRILGLSDEAIYQLAGLAMSKPAAPVRKRHWTALPIPLPEELPLEVKQTLRLTLSPTVSLTIEGLSQIPNQAQLKKVQEAARLLLEQIEALQCETEKE